jgi:hypothetical protein
VSDFRLALGAFLNVSGAAHRGMSIPFPDSNSSIVRICSRGSFPALQPAEPSQSDGGGVFLWIVRFTACGSASGTIASSTPRASCWVSYWLLERLGMLK